MFRSAAWRATRPALVGSASLAAVGVTLHEPPREKLSIYPQPDPEILLLDTPSQLEIQIGSIRRSLTASYQDAHARVQDLVSQWIQIEHAVEHRVKALVSPTEPLTPGVLYVGIAALSGSIIARNRSIFTRVLLPPTLLVLASSHFLPQTSHNVSEYLGSLEDTYFPTLAQKHDVAKAHTVMGWEMLKDKTKEARESLGRGAQSAIGQVEQSTGLKFKETLGVGREPKPGPVLREVQKKVQEARETVSEKVEQAEVKIQEVKAKVEEKVEHAKAVVEEKVEEAKVTVQEKTEEARATVGEKVEETKAVAQETAQIAEAKVEDAKEAVTDEPQEVKRLV